MRSIPRSPEFLAAPWAIMPEALKALAEAQAESLSADIEVRRLTMFDVEEGPSVRNGIAIIPIKGAVFPEDGDPVSAAIRDAAASADVAGIMLKIDSPGGAVTASQEISQAVMAARAIKPVEAFTPGMAASGAYWIASAAEKITVSTSAFLGSIGVVAVFYDISRALDRFGVTATEIVSNQSPRKRPDPTTPAGRAQIQVLIDDIATVFIADVARNRGITPEQVAERFGGGDVMISGKAIAVGMADALGTFESALQSFADRTRGTPARVAASTPSTTMTVTTSAVGALTLEASMPEPTTIVEAPVITLDFLSENHADLLAEIRTAAATTERERILGIQKVTPEGHEELAATLVADPACTVEKASVKLLDALGTFESAYLRSVQAEGEQTEGVTPGADMQFDSTERAVAFILGAGRAAAAPAN